MNTYVDAIIAGGGSPEICYHGTNVDAAQAILKNGFLSDTWFAPNLADALKFGGQHIFSVVFDSNSIPPDEWQWHVLNAVPVDQIIAYTIFNREEKYVNKELREAISSGHLMILRRRLTCLYKKAALDKGTDD